MMNAMTTASINALSNDDLKSHLTTMAAAINGMRKNTWMYAIALNEVIEGEEYIDDYETQTKFAAAVGLSKATISQYTGAVRFMNAHNYFPTATGAAFWDGITFTVGAAYLLSTLGNDYEEFTLWCDGQGISVPATPQAQLKKLMKEFAHRNDTADTTDTADTVDTTDTTDTADTTDTTTATDTETEVGVLVKDADGNEYFIPASVLALYRK